MLDTYRQKYIHIYIDSTNMYDTGLVCYFTGIESEVVLRKGPLDGPIFENYIVVEIQSTETPRPEMFNHILKVRELNGQSQKRKKKNDNLLIYRGDTVLDYREGCQCINYFDSDSMLQKV